MRFSRLTMFVITAIVAAAVAACIPKSATTDLVALIVTTSASPFLDMFFA